MLILKNKMFRRAFGPALAALAARAMKSPQLTKVVSSARAYATLAAPLTFATTVIAACEAAAPKEKIILVMGGSLNPPTIMHMRAFG